ncbi:hypothetical protein [Paenibacillus senegalensis]|uniref:hypothetical protein n=1 Tax=Paenibacillus senegalensis TaxID=1465766 RepID=UPI0011DD6245|nr:hypothetical protein [Paenibacillus senegalensis]
MAWARLAGGMNGTRWHGHGLPVVRTALVGTGTACRWYGRHSLARVGLPVVRVTFPSFGNLTVYNLITTTIVKNRLSAHNEHLMRETVFFSMQRDNSDN